MLRSFALFALLLATACTPETGGVSRDALPADRPSVSARADWRYVDAISLRRDPAFQDARWDCDRFLGASDDIRSGIYDARLQRPGRDVATRDRQTGGTTNTASYQDALQYFGETSACAFRSDEAMEATAATLAHLAEIDAFRGPKVFDGDVSFGVWSIANAAHTYAATKPYFPSAYVEVQPAIEAWLRRRIDGLIAGTLSPCPRETQPDPRTDDRCNNVDLRIQYAMTAFGAAVADGTYLSRGAAALRKHLGTMRADGSLAHDSRRGCRALLYSMDSYGFMVGMADILREHGYDAYQNAANGASIRQGIAFAVSVVDDNQQIMQYAQVRAGRSNDRCPDRLPFRASLDWFEWAYPFVLTYPADPLSQRIRPVLDAEGKRSSHLFAVAPYLYARH